MPASKAKSNSIRRSCRSRWRVKTPENSSNIKSSQPKAISCTGTRILDLSNSGEDVRPEVMGLRKTVESMSASFTDFMQNSASQIGLGLGLSLPAGNQGLGQTSLVVIRSHFPETGPQSEMLQLA